MIRKHTLIRSAAAAFAVAISMTLTGCFQDQAEQAAENAAQQEAEEVIEGLGSGEVDIEFGEIPADFPEAVPLVSTKVTHSTTIDNEDGRGIMVMVADPREPAEVAQQVRDDFAVWEEVVWSDMGELVSAQYTQGELAVLVGIATDPDSDGSVVTYSVFTD